MLLTAILPETKFTPLADTEVVKLTAMAFMLHDINTKFGDNDESSHKHIAYGIQAILDGKDPADHESFIDYRTSGLTNAQFQEWQTVETMMGDDAASLLWDEFKESNQATCTACWKKILEIYNFSNGDAYRDAFLAIANHFAWYAIAAKWTHAKLDD